MTDKDRALPAASPLPSACEIVYVPHPFDDLWGHLEYAAKDLSDALTGGGVHARNGASVASVLQRAAQRDQRLINALNRMNRILREMDRRRQPIERAQATFAQAIEARRAETGTGSVHESAVPEGDAPKEPSYDH